MKVEKPDVEVLSATEPEDVDELDGDDVVALLSVSVDFSFATAGGLRREDTCALRT